MYSKDSDIIHVIPVKSGRKRIQVTGFNDLRPGFNGEEVPFWVYEVDSEGNVIKDQHGKPKHVMVYDEKANRDVPKKYRLAIPENGILALHRTRDKAIIEQLQECPHCEGVDYWKGIPTSNIGKWFRIYDPAKAAREREEKYKLEHATYDHSRALSDSMVRYNAKMLTYIYNVKGIDHSTLEDYRLRQQYEDFARNNPKLYNDYIINNKKVTQDMLVALALDSKIMILTPKTGYVYINEDGQHVELGTSLSSVYATIASDTSSYIVTEIERRINFAAFREALVEKVVPTVEAEKTDAEKEAMLRRIAELEAKLAKSSRADAVASVIEGETKKKRSIFAK